MVKNELNTSMFEINTHNALFTHTFVSRRGGYKTKIRIAVTFT